MKNNEKIRKLIMQTALDRGWMYDRETGISTSPTGINPYVSDNGYHMGTTSVNRKQHCFGIHRLAWYIETGETPDVIDHINGIKTDNRIINLREVTSAENRWNTTKTKGYSLVKRKISDKVWRAQLHVNKKTLVLGYYSTEEEAKQVHIKAKLEYQIIGDIDKSIDNQNKAIIKQKIIPKYYCYNKSMKKYHTYFKENDVRVDLYFDSESEAIEAVENNKKYKDERNGNK